MKKRVAKGERHEERFVEDVRDIIDSGVYDAAASVNQIATMTYWRVGRRIVEEEQKGSRRAAYGTRLIEELSKALLPFYGDRYAPRRLRDYRLFYVQIPDFEIWHSRVPNLSWTATTLWTSWQSTASASRRAPSTISTRSILRKSPRKAKEFD